MSDNPSRQVLAAVDLGSNSFHMIVARYEHGHLHVIDRLREMVRLAAGLDEHGKISPTASERALDCISRFGQRLRDMHAANVRAVGTNALRKAKNSRKFLEAAEEALGHPIEVVSGREEARLVYLGAAHSLSEHEGQRLVLDIGGGSTELIIGSGFETRELFSLYMGCVGLTERFFPGGKISAKRWQRARIAALMELEPVRAPLMEVGWEEAIGTSGTIRTTRNVLVNLGWSDGTITLPALTRLEQQMIESGHVDRLGLSGLSRERAPVFPGGLVILQAVLTELQIDTMRAARGALREGLVYDMLGRLGDEDARDRSVRAFERRYHVDTEQGQRVEQMATRMLEQVKKTWKLDDPLCLKLLRWSSRLHEIGLGIAHSQYHRHGAYLLENSDMAGFSNREKALLATLVLSHRRKIRDDPFAVLPVPWQRRLPALTVLLRLAVLLHRSRIATIPDCRLAAGKRELELQFQPGWLDEHPLTRADLEQEISHLSGIGYRLTVTEQPLDT